MIVPGRMCVLLLIAALSASAAAGELNCSTGNHEEFRYAWRLRGGIRFLAGLIFPTSGFGNLRTTYGETSIESTLLITAPGGKEGGWYSYESSIDPRATKTLMTYHAWAWGKKSHNERTVFDYRKGLVRIREQTPEEIENRVRKMPEGEMRDILTAIHFLRRNAATITGPVLTSIYSDGKEYPVIFRPSARRNFVIAGRDTPATGFTIVDAPGGKKWPGGVTVWLSNDDRRIPVRIEVSQSVASLQLDLQSVEACRMVHG